MIIPPDETTARKWRLFRLCVYSCLANVPDELWDGHREEIEAMREYMGWNFQDTNWDGMGLKFGQGEIYKWVKIQAAEIWKNGTNDWYSSNVKPWLDHQGIEW
jgi:hypothetical protein